MNYRVSFVLIVCVALFLNLLGPGCKDCRINADGNGNICGKGLKLARDERKDKLSPYRLVIELHRLKDRKRDKAEFLRGFMTAYAETNETSLGEERVALLNESLENDYYGQGHTQGQRHVRDQVTDERVQEMIRQSLNLSRGSALGWKAGYVEGFVEEMLVINAGYNVETLYNQAETMYRSLKRGIGL